MRCLFVFPLLFLASVVHAEPTVQTLKDSVCHDTSTLVCASFVGSTIEAFELGAAKALNRDNGNVYVCVPENTSWFDEAKLLMKKIEEDLSVFPEDKKLYAVGSIAAVAMSIWPGHK
jgi:hypothetical protein